MNVITNKEFYLLLNYFNETYLKKSSELLLDSCLLIFVLLIDDYSQNCAEMFHEIKQFFQTNLKDLLKSQSYLLKMRITLFISVYIDDLFKNDHFEFMACCEYLFSNLLNNDESRALSFHVKNHINNL